MKPAVLLAHPSRKSLNAAIVKATRGAVSGRADRRETLWAGAAAGLDGTVLHDPHDTPGDDALLVRGDHKHPDPAILATDLSQAGPIGLRIQPHAKPGAKVCDACSNGRGVFANPRCEHQIIQAAQRRGQRPDLAGDPIGIDLKGLAGVRPPACEQGLHVAADPGEPQET